MGDCESILKEMNGISQDSSLIILNMKRRMSQLMKNIFNMFSVKQGEESYLDFYSFMRIYKKELNKKKLKVVEEVFSHIDTNGEDKVNYVKIPANRIEKIIPSGSNFSIMFPNIGVTLKEDDKIKEGTRDFGMYFKKYSISDYDRILRDYLPIQNKTMLKNI